MERIQHDLIQGSDEWHEFRLNHDGASEAAAALGMLTKKTTRAELMFAKHTGIAKEFSKYVQDKILDGGHEAEAAARPIVETIIGEPLYPVTYSLGRLSASCDGLTASDQIAMEHKRWNQELAASIAAGILPDEHQPQCQQVMHVTGAEKLLFVCSDGTRENMVYMWVYPDQEWVDRIVAGWDQFHEELKAYRPPEVIQAVVARPTLDLPIPLIEASGAIAIRSNLTEFGQMLTAFIDNIPKQPRDDQDFADCKAALTKLKAAEDALEAGEARAMAQLTDIDGMRREKKLYFDLSRTTRLALEKLVVEREKAIKVEIMQEGKDKLAAHIATLNKRLSSVRMPDILADFAAAIKGKKTIKGLRDGVEALLTQKILEASAIADKISLNLQTLTDEVKKPGADYRFLFSDYATLVMKEPDHLMLVIKSRIADHLAAEAKREEETRQRIRAEEEAKAAAKVKAEQESQRLAEASRKAADEAKAKAEAEEAERQRRASEEAAAKIERDRAAGAAQGLSLGAVLDAVAPAAINRAMNTTEPAAQPAPTASSPRLDETAGAAAPIRTAVAPRQSLRAQLHDAIDQCSDGELQQIADLIYTIAANRSIAA